MQQRERIAVGRDQAGDLFEKTAWRGKFTAEEFDAIIGHVHLERVDAGSEIFHQGDPAEALYILLDGEVEIAKAGTRGQEKVLVTLRPGSPFGEMSLMDSLPRSATARTRAKSEMIVLPRDNFLALTEAHPRLGLKIVSTIARLVSLRLRQADDIIVEYLS